MWRVQDDRLQCPYDRRSDQRELISHATPPDLAPRTRVKPGHESTRTVDHVPDRPHTPPSLLPLDQLFEVTATSTSNAALSSA